MMAMNARENATRLLNGRNDRPNSRRADAAQSANANGGVSGRSNAQREQSAGQGG
jgi:hypothetical protein